MGAEIKCKGCGQLVLARREPVYEGFRKVGEVAICTACGHRHDPEEALDAIESEKRPEIFGEEDLPETPKIFSDSERRTCCRYCKHYLVSRFDQKCGLTLKTIEATDLCFKFERRDEKADSEDQDLRY